MVKGFADADLLYGCPERHAKASRQGAKRLGELRDGDDRGVARPALDAADERLIDIRAVGQVLLSPSALNSRVSHVLAES